MRSSKKTSFEKIRGVSEVRVEADVAHVVVNLPADQRTPDKHLGIYKSLGAAGIPLRLIKMHPGGISFAVERPNLDGCKALLKGLGYKFHAADDMVIISINAVNMREMWGVMATMAETLLVNRVDIVQVGDSHDAVLCMVPRTHLDVAVKSLRTAFAVEATEAAA